MTRSTLIGIGAALFAAFVWALNFIVPFVIGHYSVFDFALLRFVVSGLICIVYVGFHKTAAGRLTLRDWLLAFWLGMVGYLGYFLTLAGAAIYAGPVVAPAIIGLVPLVLAVAGNLRQPTVPWRALTVPLALTTLGLFLIHKHPTVDPGSPHTTPVGVALAIAAVGLWTWFGLLNESALARRPGMNARLWTALIVVGAAVGMLVLAPAGFALGLSEFPRLGFGWEAAGILYLWGIALALLASIGGALAWTIATQNLPVAFTAQLVIMEAVFGVVLGLVVHRRWPTAMEITGMLVLIAGVMAAIHVFNAARSRFTAQPATCTD